MTIPKDKFHVMVSVSLFPAPIGERETVSYVIAKWNYWLKTSYLDDEYIYPPPDNPGSGPRFGVWTPLLAMDFGATSTLLTDNH